MPRKTFISKSYYSNGALHVKQCITEDGTIIWRTEHTPNSASIYSNLSGLSIYRYYTKTRNISTIIIALSSIAITLKYSNRVISDHMSFNYISSQFTDTMGLRYGLTGPDIARRLRSISSANTIKLLRELIQNLPSYPKIVNTELDAITELLIAIIENNAHTDLY